MRKHLLPLWLTVPLFIQCNNSVAPSEDRHARNLTSLEKRIVASNNSFGLNLFRQVNASEYNNNVFISPLSVSMALAMTLNGANGATLDSMQRALAFTGISPQEINETYLSLIGLFIQLDPQVKFQIANSIWYRNTFSVEGAFIDLNRQYFNAEVRSLDFASVSAADIINGWVDVNTNGKIKSIIDPPIPDNMMMYLINAIYFKGTWTYEFKKDQTKDDYFNGPGGVRLPCRMMSHKAKHRYGVVDNVQVLDLAYGNADYGMTVLLPGPGTDVEAFISSLDRDLLGHLADSLQEQDVSVFLPMFRLEYKKTLNQVLSAMGMGIAFSDWADFTKINRQGRLCISEVKHKTFVVVNEEGTEAAAVTSVGIGVTSGPSTPVFRADRPFVFAIRENKSGTILFIGKIVLPAL